MGRISIAGLLGVVVAFALGLAALVNANEFWAGGTLLVTLAALLGSVLGAILRGWRGGGWLGFALFGWGFFLFQIFTLWIGLGREMRSISEPVSTWIFEKANPAPKLEESMIPQPPPTMPTPPMPPMYTFPPPIDSSDPVPTPPPGSVALMPFSSPPPPDPPSPRASTTPDPNAEIVAALERRADGLEKAREIGRWLLLLAFAGLGSIVGIVLARGRAENVASSPPA